MDKMTTRITSREKAGVAALCVSLLFCYHLLFSSFFHNANGTIGNDYSYFLPQLLDGYYWYRENGFFAPQWFTPAFCGGLPALPNPQNIFYSVPQLLTIFTNPLDSVYLSFLTFAAIGFIGFYWLLRISFRTSLITGLLGATLFFFNGFYSHRLLNGHLTFHAFMLLPLVAFLLLRQHQETGKHSYLGPAIDVSFAALLLAYMVYSGMAHILPPVLLTLMAIGIIHKQIINDTVQFWWRFIAAGALGMALSATKLAASLAFLHNFERASYPLPGAATLWGLLKMTAVSLFLEPSSNMGSGVMVNTQWALGREEFEYGITLVPLALIAIGAVSSMRSWPSIISSRNIGGFTWVSLGILLSLISVPLLFNYYSPDWHAFLKKVPIIRSSSNLLRWLCMYIPLIILVASLILERSHFIRQYRLYVGVWAVVSILVFNVYVDRGYYENQSYDSSIITAAYYQSKAPDWSPAITRIQAYLDDSGHILTPIYRNNTFVNGGSQLACYEPILGFGLENFPILPLHPGPIIAARNGVLNIKNPACYLFDSENNCMPGDHFSTSQIQEAQEFSNYKPFSFNMSTWQYIANFVTLTTIGILIFLLVLSIYQCTLRIMHRNQS